MNFNQQILYVMILTLSVISIVYFYNISEIDAQVNRTQASIKLDPEVVEVQPPVNINTSQTIQLEPGPLNDTLNANGLFSSVKPSINDSGALIGVKEPISGQIIARDVKFVPPAEVTGPSITGTLDTNGLFSRSYAPESAFSDPLVPSINMIGDNAALKFLQDHYSLAKILNDTNDIIDWPLTESVIAIKVENADKHSTKEILINAFMNNQYKPLAKFPVSELYNFIHIPFFYWEAPAITIDVILDNDGADYVNYTKSPMCNTYIELGKLYKCNIIIE